MCFLVLFESLHGRGTADVGGELVPQSGGGHAQGPIPKGPQSRGLGIASLSSSEDLRDRGGGVGVGEVREVTGGPEREGTLNRMQNLTGKQWSCIGVAVMCCQGLMPVKTLAAGFCP